MAGLARRQEIVTNHIWRTRGSYQFSRALSLRAIVDYSSVLPDRRFIDLDEEKVFVDRTKEEIKNAPEFDPERGIDPTYQDEVGGYYGRYYS